MFLSLAWSQLSYGILASVRGGVTVIKRLEAVQHRLVRNMYGSSSLGLYESSFFALVKLFNEINKIDDSSYFNERLE